MKHSNNELFTIKGVQGVFTAEAVKGMKNISTRANRPENAKGCIRVYLDSKKITYKMVYTYGEKTWFDTKEERDIYRAEQNEIRKAQRERNVQLEEIKKELSKCSVEQLKEILKIVKNY